ncbi:Xanthine dehydrogenase [Orchesella cincta]|uniref:xanthine dehydrogenase n=1 Tax=Orchesella cincta TaxID=48709 RepID=A0A1D2N7I1_ORCCI|nr:Xanthine dehydrogenase [Orchesella cincta]
MQKNPNPEWTLLYFLRFKLRLCGTKEACGEGGCGACTVLQAKFDESTGKIVNAAINACITPLCSTHGSAIITTEGIGSVKAGLHPVQERIAKSHGTQCGFCTPGFVMSMYALLRNNPEPTEQEMEDAFQGNLCRCTGYRTIMEGFKTFCKETAPSANGCCGGKGKNGGCCMDGFINDGESRTELADTLFDPSEFKKYDPKADIIFPSELQLNKNLRKQSLKFQGSDVTWLKPSSLEELLKIKQQHPNSKCVGGNTELGIEVKFKQQLYPVLIYISEIDELTQIQVCDNRLKIGSAVTLSRLQTFCKDLSSNSKRSYGTVLEALLEMLHWFAGQQIRNVATIAGNIITASPISDLIPVLMASGAVVNLRSLKGQTLYLYKYRIEPKLALYKFRLVASHTNT